MHFQAMARFLLWLMNAIPRAPRRAGLLMRIYYLWNECFTYAGHVCAALFPFSIACGAIAGFWAAWVLSGFIFLFMLALVPSLFMTARKTKFLIHAIEVRHATEGEKALVSVRFQAVNPVDSVSLLCMRMDPSLECIESPALESLPAGANGVLECGVATRFRGAYKIPKVALAVPEIKGMLRYPFPAGEVELLVYPRVLRILAFRFLTSGASGQVFAPLLMSGFVRGLDFAGVREYREGDSLRDLHHRAYARYGKPFTKEFETERGAGVVLLLDVNANGLREKSLQESLIRLAAGVSQWLVERGILGRFFVNDDEVSLPPGNMMPAVLEALARIPRAEAFERWARGSSTKLPAGKTWSPAARPMGPVLRLGLHVASEPLVNKHVVVCSSAPDAQDDTLFVPVEALDGEGVSL